MQFLPTGHMIFDDVYEMYYNLFLEIGLAINHNSYLYDTDTGIELKYKDKYIKASVSQAPIYPGMYDIIFDPATNYNLVAVLLGYYIDKVSKSGEDTIGYIAQYIEDNGSVDDRKQRIAVKTNHGDYFTNFYYNLYLAYIEMIFLLGGNTVYLSNFDIVE